MIDGYIILNRKVSLVIRSFVFSIGLIMILVIWGINTLNYQSFFHIHCKVSNFNSYYVLEVLIPEKEVNEIINKNLLLIEDIEYNYSVVKIESDIIYMDNENFQKIYLEVFNLDDKYKKNNYRLDIKIEKDNKKIIDYLIE